MLTTPALLRLLLTTAAQSRDCARPGLGRFDRSHIRAFLATVLFPISVRGRGLRGISAIGFDFSRRGRRFFAYSCGCCCWSLGFLACHSVLVISRGIVRNDGRLRSLWLFD